MKNGIGLIRGAALALLVTLVTAGVGFGAAGGSSTVTIAAAAALDITVAGAAAIASTAPGACGTASSVINVKSNKGYNLQIRSNPVTYPNGKAKNVLIEMTNAFQYGLAGAGPWTNMTAAYVNMFGASQPKTTALGVDHTVWYQQCIDFADDPATYTIVVEFLGIQP